MRFEEANLGHIKKITHIYNYYIKNTTATFHTKELDIDSMKSIVFSDDKRYKTYVVIDDDICGYCLLTKYSEREAFYNTAVVTIYIDKDYISRGIGKRALELLEREACKNDFHTLLALICNENKGSIALFEKYDYKQVGLYKEVGYKFNRYIDLAIYQKMLKN